MNKRKRELGFAGNYMDTEETILALKNMEKEHLDYESQSIHQAIELLKEGEKYEAIVKEIKSIVSSHTLIWLEKKIKEIEEKYFSKKINRIIEVEVEASNKEVIDELAQDISDMANGQSHRKGKIRVISTRWVRD